MPKVSKELKIISYDYSLKERTFGRLNFIIKVLLDRYFRPKRNKPLNLKVDREIKYKNIDFKECLITCYFTNLKDPIKGFVRKNPDINYIAPWYNSVRSLGLNGIIVHDGLTEEFISKYETEKILFIKYKPGRYSIFEERWMAYFLILKNSTIRNVFITDANDITVNSNPFERHRNKDLLYVGRDQANRVGDSQWILDEMNNFIEESNYKVNPIVLNQILFNAGILGGEVKTVLPIIQRIIRISS